MLKPTFEKLELEYPVNSSLRLLHFFLYTPSGLTEWFCDDLNIEDDIYTFSWGGEHRSAKLINSKANKFAQFRWLDLPENTFFEFRLETGDVTKGISLFITDFEPIEDVENSKLLWDSQVGKLLQCIGA